jgi:hypothetical protein
MNILQEGKKLQPIKLQKSERAVPRHYKIKCSFTFHAGIFRTFLLKADIFFNI